MRPGGLCRRGCEGGCRSASSPLTSIHGTVGVDGGPGPLDGVMAQVSVVREDPADIGRCPPFSGDAGPIFGVLVLFLTPFLTWTRGTARPAGEAEDGRSRTARIPHAAGSGANCSAKRGSRPSGGGRRGAGPGPEPGAAARNRFAVSLL